MRKSFNVLNEPWIPVVTLDGSRKMLGIRETLKQAPELREISIVDPTEEFSVYRFLSVILMDALRPMTTSDLHDISVRQVFDQDRLDAYYSLCEAKGITFDIFDKERPFMQPAYSKLWDNPPESATRMDYTFPSGNNHVHFEHRNPDTVSYTFGEAFSKMLACHCFMPQGGSGYSPGINGAPPYYCLISGANLFQTLCTLLVPLEDYMPNVAPCPAISNMEGIEPKKPRGEVNEETGEVDTIDFFQAMLFPCRRIILLPDAESDTVSKIHFARGFKYAGGESWVDPNVSYRWSAPDKDGNRKRFTVKPDLDVSAWRNFAEMIREEGRPAVLNRYMESDPTWTNASITLYGMQTDQSKCCNLLRCNLEIPRSILASEYKADFLKECLTYSEGLSRRLEYALRVAIQGEKPDSTAKEAKKANAQVKTAVHLFFSECEPLFFEMVEDACSLKKDDSEEVLKQWKKKSFAVAKKVFNSAAGNIHASGRVLRQIAAGQRILFCLNRQESKKEE